MKLAKYLKEKKIEPSAFAEKIGVATFTLRRYLAGRVPDPKVVEAIHRATRGKVQPNDFYQLR
jgi:DNA-binding transcriptional regulator YdaS (Cro superfamily)